MEATASQKAGDFVQSSKPASNTPTGTDPFLKVDQRSHQRTAKVMVQLNVQHAASLENKYNAQHK